MQIHFVWKKKIRKFHWPPNDGSLYQNVKRAKIQELKDRQIFCQLSMICGCRLLFVAEPTNPQFYPLAMAKSFGSCHEARHQRCPFRRLKIIKLNILKMGYLFPVWECNLRGLILICRFSRIRAKSVVVNATFLSSSIGIFIRMSFL